MRIVTFQSVLWGVASLAFGTPDDLQTQQAASLTRYINKELRTAWEEFFWPELCVSEQRRFRDDWSASPGSYASGDEVYHPATDRYYRANAATTGADVPGASSKWDAATDLDYYVAYDQAGKQQLGEVIAVWDRDPRKQPDSRQKVAFSLSSNGVQFWQPAGTSVWIEYRLPVPEFTANTWSAGTYTAGSAVYYAADGQCYSALANTNATPGTDATEWQLLRFPYALKPYVVQAAYAEWLQEDGQNDKASMTRGDAEQLLLRAMQQVAVLQRQTATFSVR